MNSDRKTPLLVVYGLLLLGLVQVYSSSLILASEKFSNPYHFFYKQIFFVAIGLMALIVSYKVPLNLLLKFSLILWGVVTIILTLTLVPGIGVKVGGARRWIGLPMGMRLEPSEFLKLLLPVVFASFFLKSDSTKNKKKILYLLAFAIPLGVLLKQPDFGSFAILVTVFISLLFVLGLAWKFISVLTSVSLLGFYFLVWSEPYRKARVLAFWDPWSNPKSAGFHTIQSLLSFQTGGLWGRGFGAGQSKLYFLPEAHTDYTLAVWGEETGFIGFILLMLSYAYLIHYGFRVAMKLERLEYKILVMGLTFVFTFSVFINVGVVLGLLPSKGLTLPFMSYGGSSLVMFCTLWGLIFNTAKQCRN